MLSQLPTACNTKTRRLCTTLERQLKILGLGLGFWLELGLMSISRLVINPIPLADEIQHARLHRNNFVKSRANCFNIGSILSNSDVESVCHPPPPSPLSLSTVLKHVESKLNQCRMCVETLCPQQSTSFIKIELMFKQMLKQFAREHSICYSEGYSAVKRNVFFFFCLRNER